MRRFLPIIPGIMLIVVATLWSSGRDLSVIQRTDTDLLSESSAQENDSGPVEARVARFIAREAICRELLAGRLTLIEAAAVFGWLDDQPPVIPTSMRQIPILKPGNLMIEMPGEWLCLRAAQYARGVAQHDFSDRAVELDEHLGDQLNRVLSSGEANDLPMVNENACRALLERSLVAARTFMPRGPLPAMSAADLQLVGRKTASEEARAVVPPAPPQ